ncbi:hypothetical protein [Paramagnetospirillum marisnigri]|uniref:hypothetical protein n=1 Tax=Paramagnetospirillum marisnigri TaxID=1285242 RepID=UPI000AA99D29|nr:hypothetical protein [Paramagnetospirillum marisnigri]
MSEEVSQPQNAAPQQPQFVIIKEPASTVGVAGILSIVFGGISVFIFSIVTSPIGFIAGIFGLMKPGTGRVLSIIGIILSIVGALTSPVIMGMVGAFNLASIVGSAANSQKNNAPKIEAERKAPPPVGVTATPVPKAQPQPALVEPERRPNLQQKPISGRPVLTRADTLNFDGSVVRLLGIVPSNVAQADNAFRDYVAHAGVIDCLPQGNEEWSCFAKERNGADLAEVALLSGFAKTSLQAPPRLIEAEAMAKSQKKGIWGSP